MCGGRGRARWWKRRGWMRRSEAMPARKLYDHSASYADVTAAFVAESRHNLMDSQTRLEHCLNQLTDEELWWRPTPEMNSIANLILHLCGNIGLWITSTVENTPSARNRSAEFTERG